MSNKITPAHQMPQPHVYSNFRRSLDEQAMEPKPHGFRDRRPGMSPRHLELIRQCDCSVCNDRHRVEAHHLKHGPAGKERGVYLKATDRWSIPLCRFHHNEVERVGSRREHLFFYHFGVASLDLARALWAATGDGNQMQSIVTATKQLAIRKLGRMAQVHALMRHGLTKAEAEEQVDFVRVDMGSAAGGDERRGTALRQPRRSSPGDQRGNGT